MAAKKRTKRLSGLERAIAEDRAGQEIVAAAERAKTAKMAKEAIAARNRKASPQPKPKAMPIFEVRWCESLRHITRVQADSEEEARELVMAGEFEARDDMVIDDSFEGITSVKKAE